MTLHLVSSCQFSSPDPCLYLVSVVSSRAARSEDCARAYCGTRCTRACSMMTSYGLDWSLFLLFSTGSEHAQRDAEQADKINSDSLKDTKPPSPQFKRGLTASERRSLEAEKRAALRQQRMRELEEDAMKAQVVIAQVKAMSASSLETLAISPPDADRKSSASDNELHDGGLGRRSSGSSTKST